MSQITYNKGPAWPPKQRKHWGERKWEGKHVCALCGETIYPKRGEEADRHQKKSFRKADGGRDTFWTMKHKGGCPTAEGR